MRDGFVITKVNNKNILSMKDFNNALETVNGGLLLEGKYPDQPGIKYFALGL